MKQFEDHLIRGLIDSTASAFVQRHRKYWLHPFISIVRKDSKETMHILEWYDKDFRELLRFVEREFGRCDLDLPCVKTALVKHEEKRRKALYPTLPKSIIF